MERFKTEYFKGNFTQEVLKYKYFADITDRVKKFKALIELFFDKFLSSLI